MMRSTDSIEALISASRLDCQSVPGQATQEVLSGESAAKLDGIASDMASLKSQNARTDRRLDTMASALDELKAVMLASGRGSVPLVGNGAPPGGAQFRAL